MIENDDFSETAIFSEAAIARRLMQLLLTLLVGFGAVSLALGYWSVVRGEVLAERPDNPRTVEAALRVQRGRILDRNNVVLAENVGALNEQARAYPWAEAGPAVGHYDLRFGAAGVEEAFDAVLNGRDVPAAESAADDLLHIPPDGRDVRLALDLTLQQTGARLMHDQQGALILIELTDADGAGTESAPIAEVRVMVSQPWYDPNELEALFEHLGEGEAISFFNRVTQGQYQSGLVLFPLLAAEAIDNGVIDPAGSVTEADRPISIAGQLQRCLTTPSDESMTWLDTIHWLCPGAAADLADLIGIEGLVQAYIDLGLTSPPAIPIPVAEATSPQLIDLTGAAMGQDALTVSPLQVVLAYGALAGNGRLPTPLLVNAVQSASGSWVPVESPGDQDTEGAGVPVFRPASASLVRRALPQADELSGFSAPVLAAPGGQTNEWYVGIAPTDDPRYVVVVVLEQPEQANSAEVIGRAMLAQAMLQP